MYLASEEMKDKYGGKRIKNFEETIEYLKGLRRVKNERVYEF